MKSLDYGKKNLIEKIVNFLLNILIFIFGIILLVSIYTGIQTKILGNKYTNFFGYSIFEVQTGSMKKTINPGDWIITKITQDVKLNDVITYELDGEYITHRVIEVYNGTYVTKGDANNTKDAPVDQKQVVGKEVAILHSFGLLRKTLFNPAVIITLIITLFLLNLTVKKNKEEDAKKGKVENDNFLDMAYAYLAPKIKKIISDLKDKKHNNINKPKKEKETNNSDEPRANVTVSEISDVEHMPVNEEEHVKPKEKVSEEDLEKTSFFRVVSVNAKDIGDKYDKYASEKKEEVEESSDEINEETEEDLDKTSLYRVISVDADEVDSTLLEIADQKLNSVPNSKDIKQVKQELPKPELDEEEPKDLTNIDLTMLKNKRSGQNTIDTAMFIKKEELSEIINILLENEKARPNEATVRTVFMNNYINAKYYNYFEDAEMEINTKSLMLRIEKVLNKVTEELIKTYKGSNTKYDELVNSYAAIFMLIANIEKAKDTLDDSKVRNEFYHKVILKYNKELADERITAMINDIVRTQKNYSNILEAFLKKLETNMFDLNVMKLTSRKNLFLLDLQHNISFSKVYSDYVIDRTYAEGVIAEDKISVLVTLLSLQLVKDMLSCQFNKKYVLYIPSSLYAKEKKLEKVLKMFDNKYAKDNAIILLPFTTLINNKKEIKEIRKNGYKFALVFEKNDVVKEKDRASINVASCIFINKKFDNTSSIIENIPEELKERILYEDITSKLGDFGSDKE